MLSSQPLVSHVQQNAIIHADEEDAKDTENTTNNYSNSYNLRGISSWNVWGVPWASEKIFHRRNRWRPFNDDKFIKTIEENTDSHTKIDLSSDLLISSFQESWSWHHGPLMKYWSNKDESKWKSWKERIILILGIITFPFVSLCNFIWDTQHFLLESQDKNRNIPFKYCIGENGLSLTKTKFIDSGLCILSTWKPIHYGFCKYTNHPTYHCHPPWSKRSNDPEIYCNKGLIWGYFVNESNSCGTLIINTHLACNKRFKLLQIKELEHKMDSLRKQFEHKTEYFELYLMGDFNSKLHELEDCDLGFQHISSTKPTNSRLNGSIDHIFAYYHKYKQNDTKMVFIKSEPIKPWEKGHDQCPRTPNSLSDHCWQCILIEKIDYE